MTTTDRAALWRWDRDEASRARLRAELVRDGFSAFATEADSSEETMATMARRSPWQLARDLFGETPTMVEMQPIEPREGARSFAATRVFTPLHTDSQSHLGVAPDAIVMACVRPAARDLGAPLVADAWALASRIAETDHALYQQLFTRVRRIPFLFGDVWGPTLALRGCGEDASLVFTHSPMPPRAGDPIAQALAPWMAAMPTVALSIGSADTLVVDNHRMLHGRTAFEASPAAAERSFVRLLVWLSKPLGTHAEHARRARAFAAKADAALDARDEPPAVRARFGRAPASMRPEVAARRLSIVLEMLRGVPPGMLAAREAIAEPELYRWRDAAMTAAADALAKSPDAAAADAALGETLLRLRRTTDDT